MTKEIYCLLHFVLCSDFVLYILVFIVNFAQELGLIVCTDFHEPGQKSKGSLITEFMHLSIQELLAMGYLLSQGKAKATQIFNNMWTTKRFHMAQLYLFGFCYDDGIDPDGINLVVYISDQETSNELKQDLLEALLQNAAKVWYITYFITG